MEIYKKYAVATRNASKLLSEVQPRTKPGLFNFIKEKKADPLCSGLDLVMFLSTPVKRVWHCLINIHFLSRDTSISFINTRTFKAH